MLKRYRLDKRHGDFFGLKSLKPDRMNIHFYPLNKDEYGLIIVQCLKSNMKIIL